MPCRNAIIKEVHTVSPDMKVEEALNKVRDNNLRAMPVINANGRMVGMFSLTALLESLLPTVATLDEGLDELNFIVDAGAGVAKKLRKVKEQTVADVMRIDFEVADIKTELWEVIRMIAKNGSPLCIIEDDADKNSPFVGIISAQSAMRDLERRIDELDATNK